MRKDNQPVTVYRGKFNDKAVYDPTEKTALSVRDGVIEYLGAELDMEPADKMFTVYRSPATIANTAMRMRGLAITDGHVDLDLPPPSNGGFVSEAEMVDASAVETDTTIAIRNKLAISDTLLAMVEAGRRELSLGYHAELVPHEDYDFEQRGLVPHHLATVDQGRCGPMCSFIDKKPTEESDDMKKTKLHKAFVDAEGVMNLQQIVELAAAMPEAIKAVPVDQLKKLLPALSQISEAAKAVTPAPEGDDDTLDLPGADAEAEAAAKKEEEEKAIADAAAKKEEEKAAADAAADTEEKKFSDALVKATDEAVKVHGVVITKARDFLPDEYNFADKDTVQIMRDAIATDNKEQFADSELPLAFKMLRKPDANYKQFGDEQKKSLSTLKDKEL